MQSKSILPLFLVVLSLPINSALIVYPAELAENEELGNVTITSEHVSSSVSRVLTTSDVIARIMNSMPKAETEPEHEGNLIKSSNQIVFETTPDTDAATDISLAIGLRGGKIPPTKLETLNSTKSETVEGLAKDVVPVPHVHTAVEPSTASSVQIDDGGVDHVKIPLESDKSQPHPSYLLEHILAASGSGKLDNDPIILKPKFPQKKSILAEIAGRPCLHCPNFGNNRNGFSMGRNAGGSGPGDNRMFRFTFNVPESEDMPIELDSRELMRRRRNFQRISALLPDHRSNFKSGPAIFFQSGANDKKTRESVQRKTPKTSRSFLSTIFSYWPFGQLGGSNQPQNQQSLERLRQLVPAKQANPDEQIIITPRTTPTPKPLAMDEILVTASSGSTFNTMNEIHEELIKQNTVKLQSTESSGQITAHAIGQNSALKTGTLLVPLNALPEPRHAFRQFRGLLPFYTFTSDEDTKSEPKPTQSSAEQESLAQIDSTRGPFECPYSTYRLRNPINS